MAKRNKKSNKNATFNKSTASTNPGIGERFQLFTMCSIADTE